MKQQEAAKPAAEAKLAPLAALSSLFGGKPKPNAAIAPGVKVAAKLAVKPVAAFSFFGKSTAPKPAPAATRTIETKAPPAATRVIIKELETTKLQANASPFAVFFASKPKPTKAKDVELPPAATTRGSRQRPLPRAPSHLQSRRPPPRTPSRPRSRRLPPSAQSRPRSRELMPPVPLRRRRRRPRRFPPPASTTAKLRRPRRNFYRY